MEVGTKGEKQNMKADYRVVDQTDEAVFIEDLNRGNMSITNDAEAVVENLLHVYGITRRIIYKDSEGRWDELVHDGDKFVDFAPYKGPLPARTI